MPQDIVIRCKRSPIGDVELRAHEVCEESHLVPGSVRADIVKAIQTGKTGGLAKTHQEWISGMDAEQRAKVAARLEA